MLKNTTPKGFRLSPQGRDLLAALSDKHGVNQTAVMEMAIREKAERDGVTIPGVPPVAETTAKDAD
jgi:hypothetical protein